MHEWVSKSICKTQRLNGFKQEFIITYKLLIDSNIASYISVSLKKAKQLRVI